jgi:putative DNA primase/helicase
MSDRFIYWKTEQKRSEWTLIPDTDEAKQRAIQNGAMFFTMMSLSAAYHNNGSPEPHRWGDFCLDFDYPNDIRIALTDLRTLCLSHLPQIYDIDPHEINFFLSGGKGFHATIPARLMRTEAGDPQLPLIYKKIAVKWKEGLQLKSLDLCLYCMKKGRMWRIPNIKRSNGNYKVPLLLEEVMMADPEELMKLGTRPRILESD